MENFSDAYYLPDIQLFALYLWLLNFLSSTHHRAILLQCVRLTNLPPTSHTYHLFELLPILIVGSVRLIPHTPHPQSLYHSANQFTVLIKYKEIFDSMSL